jgi:hypothetical protein
MAIYSDRIMNGPALSQRDNHLCHRVARMEMSALYTATSGSSPPESRIKSNGYLHRDQRPSSSHSTGDQKWVTSWTSLACGKLNPQNPLEHGKHATNVFAYPQQNPFLNSFDRQRPLSSHSNYSNHSHYSVPSPTKAGHQCPFASKPRRRSTRLPQPNGGFAPPPQIHSNGFSPMKHSSPPLGALSSSSSPVSKSPLPAAASVSHQRNTARPDPTLTTASP